MSLFKIFHKEEPGLLASIPHVLQGKGHYGEYLIEYALSNDNLSGKLTVYTNILVPRMNKSTKASEIDVLMLHEKGIFVFESKNYSGWIFGSADQKQWTTTLNKATKERFYNPILQNRTHVRTLAAHLGLDVSIFKSYIVFSERCKLKKVPADTQEYHICRRHHLLRDLRKDLASREVVFSEADFCSIEKKFDVLKAASTKQAQSEHTEEVKAVVADQICPFCGKPLVERRRKSDDGAFLGCSGYPKCHYIKNL